MSFSLIDEQDAIDPTVNAFSLLSMLTELADGLGLRGVLQEKEKLFRLMRPKIGSSASASGALDCNR